MSPFNLIIAGGRDFTDYDLLKTTVDEYRISRNNIRIISGSANGADALAIVYAREHNIPFDRCPADWSTHGKKSRYNAKYYYGKYRTWTDCFLGRTIAWHQSYDRIYAGAE